jgi:hypothetical protein
MHPFRSAIETGEVDRALELFSPEVVFNSPVVFRPYHGREVSRGIENCGWIGIEKCRSGGRVRWLCCFVW